MIRTHNFDFDVRFLPISAHTLKTGAVWCQQIQIHQIWHSVLSVKSVPEKYLPSNFSSWLWVKLRFWWVRSTCRSPSWSKDGSRWWVWLPAGSGWRAAWPKLHSSRCRCRANREKTWSPKPLKSFQDLAYVTNSSFPSRYKRRHRWSSGQFGIY